MKAKSLTDIYKHTPSYVMNMFGLTPRQYGLMFAMHRLKDYANPDPTKPEEVLRVGRQRLMSDATLEYVGKLRKEIDARNKRKMIVSRGSGEGN